ncbi:MAG: exopolysaccharide transport family protein [Rhizomicrobium sp.]|nr:exopolysaccharide transport family protein [Rhizomicrobium sp.]
MTAPDAPEAGFGLGDFLAVLDKRKGLIVCITLLFVAVTAAVMISLPTLYSTSAVIMLDQRKNSVADAASVLSALPTDQPSVQNQIHVLASRDLALKVIDRLHLEIDPEFNTGLGHTPFGSSRDAIVSAFLSHLDVSALGVSTSIEVAFTSRDPQKAALIANTLAGLYTQDMVATKVAASRQAAQWLSDRMHQLSQQLQNQEGVIELYKAEHDLVESQPGSSLVNQQLMAINTQLVAAQSDLAEKKAAYDQVAVLAKTGNTADVTQVVNSKMIGDLRSQEAELVRQESDMASRYGPNHPKMQAIRNQRRDLAAKVQREVDGIAGSMQSELEIAKAHVASIDASLARVGRQARDANMARIKLSSLEANLASTRTMYESFVQRLRAVQGQDDIQIPEAQIISSAPVPTAPSAPHRALFIGASIPAGLLFAILVALLLERFGMSAPLATRPTLLTPEPLYAEPIRPLRPAMAQPDYPPNAAPAYAAAPSPAARYAPPPPPEMPPLLAELAASADLRLADWLLDNPASPYGLALNGLLERLIPGRTGQARVVTITAPAAEASKSVAVLSLARIAALRGLRTIILDADLGRLSPATANGGVAGFLQGLPLTTVLLKDRRSAVYLMSASPALWSQPRTADLLNHLKQHCDLILIDAAPPLTTGPWPPLARLSDAVVLYAAAKVPQPVLEAALRVLSAMAAPLKGLLLAR